MNEVRNTKYTVIYNETLLGVINEKDDAILSITVFISSSTLLSLQKIFFILHAPFDFVFLISHFTHKDLFLRGSSDDITEEYILYNYHLTY